jgi:hypothetical protein
MNNNSIRTLHPETRPGLMRRLVAAATGAMCVMLLLGAAYPQPACPNTQAVTPLGNHMYPTFDDPYDCDSSCTSAQRCKQLVAPDSWAPEKLICAPPLYGSGWPGCHYAVMSFGAAYWRNCDCVLGTRKCRCTSCGAVVVSFNIKFRQALACP